MPRRREPAPEGFAEFAAVNNVLAIRKKFNIGTCRTVLLIDSMPEAWNLARDAVIDQMEWIGKSENRASEAQRRAARAAKKAAVKSAAIAKLNPSQEKSPPEGFFEFVLTHTYVETTKHFGFSRVTAGNYIRKLPADQLAQYRAAAAKRVHKGPAIRAAKARRNAPVNWGFHKPVATADVPGGKAQRAVDYLKRYYAPAFNAERVHGKEWAGLFVVGRERLTAEQVVARAEQHGFDLNAWRRLAA